VVHGIDASYEKLIEDEELVSDMSGAEEGWWRRKG
jgi:hypothetical protein